ncbi:MAG: HD-GYP domain-containing protein [Kiloniellaceae bacterium]
MTRMAGSGETAQPNFVASGLRPDKDRPASSRTLVRGAVVIAVIVVIAIAVPAIAIHLKKAELVAELERRLEILATGRADVIAAWLEGITRPADRVVDSDLFRLFATEMDLAGGDISDLAVRPDAENQDAGLPAGLGVPLTAQLPFMEQVLTDFTKNAGFLAGYLIGRNGVAYVTSAGADPITPEQQAIAGQVFGTGTLRYGPARSSAAGLLMDIYAPVFRAQGETGQDTPVGVMLLTAAVSARLSEVLSPPPLAEPGERLRLLQLAAGTLVEILPGRAPPLQPVRTIEMTTPEQTIPFAQRQAVGGGAPVYSVGAAVTGPPWWIIQELDVEAAGQKLAGFITASVVVAILAVVTVVAAFGAFWWRLSNEHSAALAEQYRRLAARIEAQKELLDGINNTIAEYIGLKSLDGTYRYVNPAFARAIGREVDKVTGLDDAALFGQGTARRLRLSDQRALASSAVVTTNEEVYLGAKLHYLQISKVPYQGEDGKNSGIVSVARDVTELVEEQKKKDQAIQQMVAALVRAVELRDPYLAGHSRRLAGFAVAVARRLQASAGEIATVEIAANLSQIGKLAIPRELLTKPDRLSEAEILQMQQHVGHAAAVLRDIEFELPVLETVYQMHERLDGGGYPEGLSGDRIRLTARILGACDVFCARVEPRAYRVGIAPDAALAILEENDHRYDPGVVAALREVATSVTGEKLIAGVAAD